MNPVPSIPMLSGSGGSGKALLVVGTWSLRESWPPAATKPPWALLAPPPRRFDVRTF